MRSRGRAHAEHLPRPRALRARQRLRPPAVLPLVLEEAFELRLHLLREELGVEEREIAAHVAELEQQHELPDVQRERDLAELLGHLVRAPDDHVALRDDLLEGRRPERHAIARARRRLEHLRDHASSGSSPRSRSPAARRSARRRAGSGCRSTRPARGRARAPPGATRATPTNCRKPARNGLRSLPSRFISSQKPFIVAWPGLVAEVGEVGVDVVELRAPLPGLDRAAARDPDRRVRLLDRPRPRVDVAELVEASVPREGRRLAPRLHDQVVAPRGSARAAGSGSCRRRNRCPSACRPGSPAISRPPEMQSSIANSSATRIGGL